MRHPLFISVTVRSNEGGNRGRNLIIQQHVIRPLEQIHCQMHVEDNLCNAYECVISKKKLYTFISALSEEIKGPFTLLCVETIRSKMCALLHFNLPALCAVPFIMKDTPTHHTVEIKASHTAAHQDAHTFVKAHCNKAVSLYKMGCQRIVSVCDLVRN